MPQGLMSTRPSMIGSAPVKAESTKSLEAIKNVLASIGGAVAEQPLVRTAGAVGSLFDQLYRGNVGTEPVNQGQVQIPAEEQKVAGVPFGPKQVVYHGTSKPFEKFNPYFNNTDDVLGKMTHFAEDPAYAGNEYTGLRNLGNPPYNPPDFNQLYKDYKTLGLSDLEAGQNANQVIAEHWGPIGSLKNLPKPRVIPAKLDVKNALDVSHNDPNMIEWDDLDKLIRGAYKDDPNLLDARLRGLEKSPFDMDMANQKRFDLVGSDYIRSPNKIPRDWAENALKFNPTALSETGFDAVRYADNYGGSKNYDPLVWAIENPALAKGAYTGEPLGINLKPRNLERIVGKYGSHYTESPLIQSIQKRLGKEEAKKFDAWTSPYEMEHGIRPQQAFNAKLYNRIKSMGYSKR